MKKSIIDLDLPRWRSPANLNIVHYFVQNDLNKGIRSRFTQFKSYDHFFQYLLYWYKYKFANWNKINVVIRNKLSGEEFSFCPVVRFTDEHRNRVLYKFYHTLELPVYYWITLTTVSYSGNDWFEYSKKLKNDVRYLWKRFYDYQKKYDKNFDFIRVYELTKNNTLHVHVAIYSKLSDSVLKRNIVLQNEHFGFVKAFKYVDHRLKRELHKSGKLIEFFETRQYESWFKDGKVIWKYRGYSNSSYKLLNYLMKYFSKEASLIHRAIFSFFRIRTYSISKSMKLPTFDRKSSDTFEFVQLDWLSTQNLNSDNL